MKNRIASIGLLLLGLALSPAWAQIKDSRTPIETIQSVGDRIIANTPFKFRLIAQPKPKEFNFIEYLDLGRTYGLGKSLMAYALTTIESDKDTSIVLQISHNDGLMAFVNGKKVYAADGNHIAKIQPMERDIVLESEFTVALKKGNNQVLIKTETKGEQWIFYIQPKGALIEFSPVKGLKIGLSGLGDQIDESIHKISNWLVCGPFINPEENGKRTGMNIVYGPEKEFEIGKLYASGLGQQVSWTVPKVEVFADAIGAHPFWGTFYNWNYHAAGVAWTMSQLAEYTQKQKYDDFAMRYCDFFLEKKPYIEYQVNTLMGFRSTNHHLINTPLLDFTAAPTLPYVYRLWKGKPFKNQVLAQQHFESVKKYVLQDQVRLPDGTFTRETPEKYTTWVDDMYMGIPFVVHAAMEAKNPVEKAKLFDEAAKQVVGFNRVVYDKPANLYMHAQPSARKAVIPHWSRANGWGIFATTEVLLYLPKKHPQYKKIMEIYTQHLASIVKYQDEKTGLWHNVIDHPETYLETSASAIFTLAMARGLNNGWIDAKKYRPIVDKAWQGLASQIEKDGVVHNICIGTMSSEDVQYYAQRPVVDNDSHGLIGLILAGIEMQKLYDTKK